MQGLGKTLIFFGLLLVITGLILTLGNKLFDKFPVKLGHLPGDILIKKENFTFYFPLTTCIIISIILALIIAVYKNK